MKRISLIHASRKLGMEPEKIMELMISGSLPIGECHRTGNQFSYEIYEELIDKYLQEECKRKDRG